MLWKGNHKTARGWGEHDRTKHPHIWVGYSQGSMELVPVCAGFEDGCQCQACGKRGYANHRVGIAFVDTDEAAAQARRDAALSMREKARGDDAAD